MVLADPQQWQQAMITELTHKRFRASGQPRIMPEGVEYESLDQYVRAWLRNGGKAVRIHDAGDFFADWYLRLWIGIAEAIPDVLFYAYTKEVAMFKAIDHYPSNFRYLFSTGGLQDNLITGEDRHADVFPDEQALTTAGYVSQEASDLLAILLPTTRIGIVANNIPAFRKRMAGKRFSEL